MSQRSGLFQWREDVCESDCSANAKHIALTLSTWMNRRGSCFPGKAAIARRSSRSEKTVVRGIHELEKARFLVVRRSSGGGNRTNTYQACLPREAATPGQQATPGGSTEPLAGDTATPESGVEGVAESGLFAIPLRSSIANVCDECFVGGGRHTADCPRASEAGS